MTSGTRIAIVTGGFGALGRVVARTFADAGYLTARIDFASDGGDGHARFIDFGGVDLLDEAKLPALIDDIARHGTLSALVNIAGGFTWQTFADGDAASWKQMYDLNLLSALSITRAALPKLLEADEARILNIGAGAALKADAGMGAYAASKAALHRFTESLAAELAGKSITINAVLPTIIDTPRNRADMPDADFTQWVRPEAVADVLLYLASYEARAITGALVPVSRGI